jgi:hypothetical protein
LVDYESKGRQNQNLTLLGYAGAAALVVGVVGYGIYRIVK